MNYSSYKEPRLATCHIDFQIIYIEMFLIKKIELNL